MSKVNRDELDLDPVLAFTGPGVDLTHETVTRLCQPTRYDIWPVS